MSVQPHDPLAAATAELHQAIERELAERPGRRDLADVIARARAIDPDAVPEGLHAVDEDDEDQPEQLDPMLPSFAAALRDTVEGDVRERAMQPAAPPKFEQPRSSRRLAVALIAVAAAVVGAVSLAQLQQSPAILEAERGPGSLAAKSVEQVLRDDQWTRGVSPPTPQMRTRPEPAPPPQPEEEVVPEESEPVAQEPPKPTASLDQLEREAAEAWRAGQLGLAESKLRKIIARAGRGPKAELAYGDLFAITKQRGGSVQQSSAWKQYLARFPQGRFADDARAGLCMRTSNEAASRCWSDYLKQHPKGTHAARARRELAQDDAP